MSNTQRTLAVRDPAIVAAVWDEDDSFVVRTQATENRSVVVRRSDNAKSRPGQRLAQLPEDPFEETPSEPTASQPTQEPEVENPPAEFNTPDFFEEETTDAQPEKNLDDLFDEPVDDSLPEPEDEDASPEETEETEEPDEATEQPQVETPQVEIEKEPLEEVLEGPDPLESDESMFLEDFLEDENDLPDSDLEPNTRAAEEPNNELKVLPNEVLSEREEFEKNCAEEVAKVQDDRIDDIELSIRIEGSAGEDFPFQCKIDTGEPQSRQWPQITYNWKAAALRHKPLYFEQVQLERYGHSWGPYVQPIMSGVHFFGTLPILPYKMGIRTPTECVYTLGYYRPGSCAPYLIDPIPFTWRAALFEGAFATGMAFTIP